MAAVGGILWTFLGLLGTIFGAFPAVIRRTEQENGSEPVVAARGNDSAGAGRTSNAYR